VLANCTQNNLSPQPYRVKSRFINLYIPASGILYHQPEIMTIKATPVLLFLFLLLTVTPAVAQQRIDLGKNNYDDKKGIVYDKETTVDLKLHTNGASFGLNFGTLETFYKTRYWHVEIGELKHPRETRQSRNLSTGGFGGSFRSYFFGKQNNFFVLRGGIGGKRYLSEKARRKGIAVGYSYEAGPSIGILKPYYLVLRYVSEDFGRPNLRSERYSERNAQRFLNNSSIFGADSFTKGLGEISLVPGLHGKFAMHFDAGAFDEVVKAVEAGLMLDLFFRDIPIMIESPLVEDPNNRSFFLNLFVTLQLGKRS